jgi:hypothetical protein
LGTAVASVSGGSPTAYVSGPLARTLPSNLSVAATYSFPIGDGGYNPLELVNPKTVNNPALVVVQAEVTDANAGGMAGIGIASLATNRYWTASVTANAANLTQAGRMQLTQTGLVNGTNHITNSATQTGTYNMMSSVVAGNLITSNGFAPASYGYFVIADAGTLPAGTYTVGTAGQFPSFTNPGGLFDVMNAATIGGNIVASVISNINIETGSVALNQWTESPANSNYALTIQPSAGTLRTIEGGYNGAGIGSTGLFRFNGADRVTIDGRFGGSGQYLLFRNNYGSNWSATLSFMNDATNNTVRNSIWEGGTPVMGLGFAGTDGVIFVGESVAPAGGITGNDNLTFQYLDIRSNTATGTDAPVNGFFAQGTAAYSNNDITIDNCNIYNFDWGNNASGGVSGIKVTGTGNGSNWTITNNNIYRSSLGGNSLGAVIGINFVPGITSTNNTISNNYIGGSAAGATGAWPLNHSSDANNTHWIGIRMSVGTTTASTLSNNVVQKVQGIAPFSGLQVLNSGSVNVDNNTVDNTGLDYGGNFTGIYVFGTQIASVNVTRNKVTNITLPVTVPSGGVHNFTGISVSDGTTGTMSLGGSLPADGNLVNNITNTYTNDNLATQTTEGIYCGNTINSILIGNNTVSNMTANAGSIIGLRANNWAIAAAGNVVNNTVFNLSSGASTPTLTADIGRNTVVTGIYLLGNPPASGNTVYNLTSTHASAAVAVTGIFWHPVFANKVLERNFVHSLNIASSDATARMLGIGIGGTNGAYIPGNVAASTVRNNMVRLGINNSGASITNGIVIEGIRKDGNTVGHSIFNNNIYVGGTGVASNNSQTSALRRMVSGADDIRNNILANARSNSGGTGQHYAIDIGGSNASLVLDYNLYSNYNTTLSANGTDGHLFLFAGNPVRDRLPVWFTAPNVWGSDNNSGYGNPGFVAPTAATPNLHLNAATPAEGRGALIATVTDDFDGDVRASNSPNDIGADAGNFNATLVAATDAFPPRVSYSPLR